jgi:hypothetical protein
MRDGSRHAALVLAFVDPALEEVSHLAKGFLGALARTFDDHGLGYRSL